MAAEYDQQQILNNEIARYDNRNYIRVNEFRGETNICTGCADAAAIRKVQERY